MTRTLRIASQGLRAGRQLLAAAEAHYVGRVLRARVGDELLLFDSEVGLEARAQIVALDSASVTCEVDTPIPAMRVGAPWVHLVQALGKGDKPEDTLRAAVAQGVGSITWVESERSVAKISARQVGKQERFTKVALDAARQSQRGDLPVLQGPLSWADVERRLGAGDEARLRLVLHPGTDSVPLLRALPVERACDVELWVGPEGGFSETEIAVLLRAGARLVGLGPLVQRTELAALSACAIVMAWALEHQRWGAT